MSDQPSGEQVPREDSPERTARMSAPHLADVEVRPITGGGPGSTVEGLNLNREKSEVTTRQTDIPTKREDTRKLIAFALLGGLGFVCLGWTLVGILGSAAVVQSAGAALDKIFSGILGLAGTAVGFYFGAATSGGADSGSPGPGGGSSPARDDRG